MFSMKRVLFLLIATGWLLLIPQPLHSQEIVHTIDLEDGVGAPDNPFGMKLSPDGSLLYVAVCGSSWPTTENNTRLVEIDTSSFTISGEGVTGHYPEEVEFRLDGGGQIELIFVSNSSDHSVTVLKPDLSHEATVDLSVLGGQYPFGLIMDPSGRYLHVSTYVSDQIFVIDTSPGATYLSVVSTYPVSGSNGRMACFDDSLLIPSSVQNDGAYLKVLDLNNPGQLESVLLDNQLDPYGYPVSLNDVAYSADGFAYVPALDYFGFTNLYEVDLNVTPYQISRIIDMSAVGPFYTLAHGIGASPDQNTLVVTYFDNAHIKVLGRKTGTILFCFDVTPVYGQINEALFSHDGEYLYLTDQVDTKVYVLKGIPKHGIYLTGTDTVYLNGQVQMEMKGGETGQAGLLLVSLSLGPIVTKPVTLDIGWPFFVLYEGMFDGGCSLPIPTYTVPNDPALHGLKLYLQGLTKDSDKEMRPSNLHELEII